MKARNRFLLHTLLPPVIGAILIMIAAIIIDLDPPKNRGWLQVVGMTVFVMIYGYVFAIVPSVVYAALMEFGYRRGLTPGSGGAVFLSGLLGLLVGAIPFVGSWIAENFAFTFKKALTLGIWPVAGMLTGLIIEWWIGGLSRRPLTPSSSAPSRTSLPP